MAQEALLAEENAMKNIFKAIKEANSRPRDWELLREEQKQRALMEQHEWMQKLLVR